MGQQKEAQDGCVRNLVVERLAMELKECWVQLDVVATPAIRNEST